MTIPRSLCYIEVAFVILEINGIISVPNPPDKCVLEVL
jgi:hypothetical protein